MRVTLAQYLKTRIIVLRKNIMRTLLSTEISAIAGGSGEEFLLFGAGIVALAMISSLSSNKNCKYINVPIQIPFETVTPVYDPFGNYVGDQIDTYEKTGYEQKWVCA